MNSLVVGGETRLQYLFPDFLCGFAGWGGKERQAHSFQGTGEEEREKTLSVQPSP